MLASLAAVEMGDNVAMLTVPRPIRERLGEEAASSLVTLLDQVADSTRDSVIAVVEEKFERRLTKEISELRVELREEIGRVRTELTTALVVEITKVRTDLMGEIAKVRTDLMGEIGKVHTDTMGEIAKLRVEIANTRADLIRWMFVFWVGQMVAILGVLFALLRR